MPDLWESKFVLIGLYYYFKFDGPLFYFPPILEQACSLFIGYALGF